MSYHQHWLTPLATEPHHADALARLPADLPGMIRAIQGALLHADWAEAYGVVGPLPRHTLSVAERLDDIAQRHSAPLESERPPEQRSTGSCRDFALLLTAALRAKAIPARIRCGFAAYFQPHWEDHWVCQYWDAASGTWRLADAQIDAMLATRLAIGFDPADISRAQFRTAGEAWLDCRRGGEDAGHFGHGVVTGQWLMAVNVVRDHLALNGRATSDWDRWREAADVVRLLNQDHLAWLDDLAENPEQSPTKRQPDWLA